MMPTVTNTMPKTLRPYAFHGLDLREGGGGQATGTCPFCDREDKFSVSVETGLWRCYVCNEGTDRGKPIQGGNDLTFLRLLWEKSDGAEDAEWEKLASDRGLLSFDTLVEWGVRRSLITGDWLVPGWTAAGKLCQLYRYVGRPRKLLATAEMGHGLFGADLHDARKPTTYLCEGPWDAMALQEVLKLAKEGEGGGLEVTGNKGASLYAEASVLAVPGVMTFFESWYHLFAGKRLVLCFDSDHPREHGGRTTQAGLDGMRRIAGLLSKSTDGQPSSVEYINWGPGDYDPALPSGYDVRDWLGQAPSHAPGAASLRVRLLGKLLERVQPIPAEWVPGSRPSATASGSVESDCLPCTDWEVLRNAWRKALKWTDGLDTALSVMLATICSTEAVGDQLWVKVISPPSSGKSVLCEALSVCKKYVLAKSTMRGFHSGYRETGSESEDNSLLTLVKNKTLVTKDGDTLLQSPNLEQILSEARDVYDRVSRTSYRNKASKDYEGISMTWLLCGTSSLRVLDSSELGERFLDCVIVEDIDEDLEDDIAWRVVNQAAREMLMVSDGKMESRDGPEMVAAKQLTGGYVQYLRENWAELVSRVDMDEGSLRQCQHLGKFVAFMRARPSARQVEKAEREMSFRLNKQLVRLAGFLAVVTQRYRLDAEVMRRTAKVAKDTARGRTLQIAKYLHEAGDEGLEIRALAILTNQNDQEERRLLQFLRKIGAVELWQDKEHGNRKAWRLTKRLNRLYAEVTSYA